MFSQDRERPLPVVFSVDDYPGVVPAPAFGPRMVCTGCGMIGSDARRNGPNGPRPVRFGMKRRGK